MKAPRAQRLARQLQQEIAMIIQRELKDPHVGFVTITRAELSKDQAYAKVFYSCLGPREERQRSQEALERSTGFIHGLIKKRFRLKVIPQIQFRYDESIAGSIALSDMLDHLEEPSGEGR